MSHGDQGIRPRPCGLGLVLALALAMGGLEPATAEDTAAATPGAEPALADTAGPTASGAGTPTVAPSVADGIDQAERRAGAIVFSPEAVMSEAYLVTEGDPAAGNTLHFVHAAADLGRDFAGIDRAALDRAVAAGALRIVHLFTYTGRDASIWGNLAMICAGDAGFAATHAALSTPAGEAALAAAEGGDSGPLEALLTRVYGDAGLGAERVKGCALDRLQAARYLADWQQHRDANAWRGVNLLDHWPVWVLNGASVGPATLTARLREIAPDPMPDMAPDGPPDPQPESAAAQPAPEPVEGGDLAGGPSGPPGPMADTVAGPAPADAPAVAAEPADAAPDTATDTATDSATDSATATDTAPPAAPPAARNAPADTETSAGSTTASDRGADPAPDRAPPRNPVALAAPATSQGTAASSEPPAQAAQTGRASAEALFPARPEPADGVRVPVALRGVYAPSLAACLAYLDHIAAPERIDAVLPPMNPLDGPVLGTILVTSRRVYLFNPLDTECAIASGSAGTAGDWTGVFTCASPLSPETGTVLRVGPAPPDGTAPRISAAYGGGAPAELRQCRALGQLGQAFAALWSPAASGCTVSVPLAAGVFSFFIDGGKLILRVAPRRIAAGAGSALIHAAIDGVAASVSGGRWDGTGWQVSLGPFEAASDRLGWGMFLDVRASGADFEARLPLFGSGAAMQALSACAATGD